MPEARYARDWKPINYQGAWYTDPRQELAARADRAEQGNDLYVAVPLALARACAEIRECGARFTLHADEDGPLARPQEIQCRRPDKHDHDHSNGYCGWSEETAERQRQKAAVPR